MILKLDCRGDSCLTELPLYNENTCVFVEVGKEVWSKCLCVNEYVLVLLGPG